VPNDFPGEAREAPEEKKKKRDLSECKKVCWDNRTTLWYSDPSA